MKPQQCQSQPSKPIELEKEKKAKSSAAGSKRKAMEQPEWFAEFAKQQKSAYDELVQLNTALVQVAKDRNDILKAVADALLKK